MTSSASKLARRNFLLAVGTGGVVAAAAVATKSTQPQNKKAEAVTGSKGYHVTEHIRKYYATTKI